jgi:pyruvate/2-oxoglutarate dehydrogenase complex dihydrolipoamide acyltransferase (E2) component
MIISKWFKSDGDRVSKNEVLCLIKSSSMHIEFESLTDGFLYFCQKPGSKLTLGQTIGLIIHQNNYKLQKS